MKVPAALTNHSIRFRIALLLVLNSAVALGLAGIALFGYENFLQRGGASRQLSAQAAIIAESSTAALSFADQRAAANILQALRGDSGVVEGVIYDGSDRFFAGYRVGGSITGSTSPKLRASGVYFENGSVLVFQPIRLGDEKMGSIFLKSKNETGARLRRYVVTVCLILLLSQGLALLISGRLRKTITTPVTELSEVARRVSVEKDYSVRAVRSTGGEIGVLIDSFNHMLMQVEIRTKSLRESEERYALAARAANDGLWDWKITTGEIYCSTRWYQMLGYSDEEVWSDPEEGFERIHPGDRERIRAEIDAHREGNTAEFTCEYRMLRKDDSHIWVLNRGIVVRNADGKAVRMAGAQTDITENKVADPLTSLPNRLYFMDKLEGSIDSAQRGGQDFAVLFLDLDRFKLINDSLGHAAGDELLTGVATRLRAVIRAGWEGRPSVIARLGGDEFAVLLNDIRDRADAARIGQSILEKLEPPFQIEGRQIFATASIGIALGSQEREPENLLRNADTAMYNAKAQGKARCAVFDEAMRERAVSRMEIETELRKGIQAGELTLHYQPELSLKDIRVKGFEALVRWNHPKRGLLPPGEFVPVAEESDLIIHLGKWVLKQACAQMAEWHRKFKISPPLTISVNVSPRHLRDAGLIEDIERVLAETGLDPRCLKLEMTESSIMQNPETAIATLRQLKLMDIGLEIDDFGTGYSSLSYLQRLPFDTVKIDRSFVKELGARGESREIVRTIVDLARSLKMSVVAEGIETKEQLRDLVDLGCQYAQGYYFSKPVNASTAESMMPDQNDFRRALTVLNGAASESGGLRQVTPVTLRSSLVELEADLALER